MPLLFVVPPLIADKIILTLCVALFPLSARYALGAIRSEARSLAFLAIPLAYNWPLNMGFYNFTLGTIVFFFAVGFWAAKEGHASPSRP